VDDPDLTAAKAELREELMAGRRARPAAELEEARAAIRARVLERVDSGCVAAFVPLRTEPGSDELLAELAARGVRVLVPLTQLDRDLDWAQWSPSGIGPPLGVAAVSSAGLVLVPALCVAWDGTRLGRGGGSYDRALRRVRSGVETAALVFDDEVRPELPRADWDVPVSAAVTPSRWVAVGGNADFPSAR
jgi:5-formyltetrahydrofolate cyclo-ligase